MNKQQFIETYEGRIKSLEERVATHCGKWAGTPINAAYEMAWHMESVMQDSIEIALWRGIIDQIKDGNAMVDIKEILTERVLEESRRTSRSTSCGHNLKDDLQKVARGEALHALRCHGEFDDAEQKLFLVVLRKTTYTVTGKGKKAVTTAEHHDTHSRVLALSLRQAYKQAQETKCPEGYRVEKVEAMEVEHAVG